MFTKHFRYLKWRNPKTYISCIGSAYVRENPTPKIAKHKVQNPCIFGESFGDISYFLDSLKGGELPSGRFRNLKFCVLPPSKFNSQRPQKKFSKPNRKPDRFPFPPFFRRYVELQGCIDL